jgi:hypothetical protein
LSSCLTILLHTIANVVPFFLPIFLPLWDTESSRQLAGRRDDLEVTKTVSRAPYFGTTAFCGVAQGRRMPVLQLKTKNFISTHRDQNRVRPLATQLQHLAQLGHSDLEQLKQN